MKANDHNILGNQVTLTANDAAWHLASAICESLLCAAGDHQAGLNIYGRPVTHSSSGDVSFALGFAATGLRAGILLSSTDITSNIDHITTAVRLHIPLVIFAGVNTASQVNQLSQSGTIVFSACTAQEAVDLLLISYRVAEWSLIPVVVCMEEDIANREASIAFPNKEIIATLAGNSDHFISSPTAAQQIIFGKSRKRIPNWFNVDHPVSLGAAKHVKESALEAAAQQEYFYGHLDGIITDAFEEFHKVSGRRYNDLALHQAKDAEYLMLSYGSASTAVVNAIDEYRLNNKAKIAAASLVRINPFPVKAVKAVLARKKAVTVLEQVTSGSTPSMLFKEVSCLPEAKQLTVFSGHFGAIPTSASMAGVIRNMLSDAKGKSTFWIDIDFTHAESNYPKHQVLLQAIEREYPGAQQKSISSSTISKNNLHSGQRIPLSIRKYKDLGPAYARVSRFYDDTASFFLTDPGELVADPFQAVPLMPASTAAFNTANLRGELKQLPVFNAGNCTGCGDCFLHCPHAAINPIVIGIENLIKAGIAVSNANGVKITQLIPLVKNMAKAIPDIIKPKKESVAGVSDFLAEAFAEVAQQMKLEGEKLTVARQDMEAVATALNDFPVVITDNFYHSHELIKKGSGEFFSLAIDTNACTGCGVCAAVCADDALMMAEQNADMLSTHHAQYTLWEQMPDTAADTIVRQLDERKYNPFAALLLSRHYNQALHGTSSDRDGDSSKSVVRIIAAMAEASLQPKVQEAIANIDELIAGLSSNIHDQLGSALPSENFDALSKVLSEIKEDRNPFESVIEKLGTGEHLKLVDTKSLKRKVELVKSLTTLKWLLREGSTGTGRARMGFVTDGSLAWSNTYPWNQFTAPVLIQLDGTTPELARGMVQGHTREMLDNIKIIRRAQLEISGSYVPDTNDIQIAALTWNDLTPKEKNLVPPILVIGTRSKLAGKNIDALIRMLDCNWPLKAIVLDDAAPGTESYFAEITGGTGALLPVLAMRNVNVLKSSLAVPQHLFSGLSEIFNSSKPALAWVYAPSVSKHVLPSGTFPRLHALGLDARAFPVFNFNPDREGSLLAAKLNLDGNPQGEHTWMQSDLSFVENGVEKTIPYALSWADWAYTLKAWQQKFSPHTDAMGKPVLITDFVALPKSERIGKSPVIYRKDYTGELIKYHAADDVVNATEACADAWQLLREISGELTAFPEKLHKKVEAELAVAYEQRMEESKQQYEQRILNLEQEHLEKIRIKLKEKLMRLSQPVE